MPLSPTAYVLVGLIFLALVVAAWVVAPVMHGREAARRDLGSHRLVIGSIVVVLLLNALLTIPLAGSLENGFDPPTFVFAAAATQIPMLLVILVRLVLAGAVTWRDLGLRPLPLGQVIGTGVATGIGALILTIAMDAVLSRIGLSNTQSEEFAFIRGVEPAMFLLMMIPVVVTAPIVEELFFRGFIFGQYLGRKPIWMAYLVSGLLFAALHVKPNTMSVTQGVGLLIPILALGSLFAWTYRRTGSLLPGMVAHGFNNSVAMTALYFAEALVP